VVEKMKAANGLSRRFIPVDLDGDENVTVILKYGVKGVLF
jgi:hypothetical protein